MDKQESIKLFEEKQIRTAWSEEEEKWYFSIVDVVSVLTDQPDFLRARKYWNKLKQRLTEEGNETVTNCYQLKMPAQDGKNRLTDVADTEQMLRLIQSIPSKKAEPFKLWLARVGRERIDEIADPELSIDRAVELYRRKGYSEKWINQRIKSIEVRKDLTDEWNRSGITESQDYAIVSYPRLKHLGFPARNSNNSYALFAQALSINAGRISSICARPRLLAFANRSHLP